MLCAKELNIPQVTEYMKQMGITDAELEQLSDQMMDLMDGEGFEMGGSGVMPEFLQNMMKNSDLLPQEGESGELREAEAHPTKDNAKKEKRKKKKKELKFLCNYCTNLSERAANGELDDIVGRDKEISRVIQILSRRTKNNPCLIGEPGVGKTAIAEGIAQHIQSGDVPFNLQNKVVYLLDLTALVAGTQFRGQFESRVKGLVNEVKQEGNIILFIDEVHNLVGTGNSEGSMNAANILKPALSRGEIQVIGATTFEEYRKFIEKDAALERRFQPVTVNEPTIEETISVLKGIKKYYESYHRVHVSDYIVRLCATLAERYITDRFLPDKAIDLLDESCTCANLRNPAISQAQILEGKKRNLQENIENLSEPTEEDQQIDYELISKLKTEVMAIDEKLPALQEKAKDNQVLESDIASAISMWTGIPAAKIEQGDIQKLAGLEPELKAHIIGQDEAIEKVAAAVRRGRVQISPRKRPQSFIFVGPTGVGKTELAKALAQALFDDEKNLVRIDMSEYMEKFSVSRLIGAPPGYVGYEEGGQLTEAVRRRPYSVILFDEIEKAHPDVFNILLQILDDGRITDSQGRTVDFKNTIIILTSNLGSQAILDGITPEGEISEAAKNEVQALLRRSFRPEFLNRLDEIVFYKPLSKENITGIIDLQIAALNKRLADKQLKCELTPAAKSFVIDAAYDPQFGARPLRRYLQHTVETLLAQRILRGDVLPGQTLVCDEQNGELVISAK